MSVRRIRVLLAVLAVSAVVSHSVSGHAVPPLDHHGDITGLVAGLCLLLATVLVYVAPPAPATPRRVAAPDAEPGTDRYVPRPVDRRARASPAALQRFQH